MSDRVGASHRVRACAITAESLVPETLRAVVADPAAGAEVVFTGVVRDHDGRPDKVTGLTYEAHPGAVDALAAVCAEVAAAHDVIAVAAEHRTGALAIGDIAVVVAVSAAHRAEAFTAAAELIDTLKKQVPIWKHQRFVDGSEEWVGL